MRSVLMLTLVLVALVATACDCPSQMPVTPASYAACAPAPQAVQYVQVAQPQPVQYAVVHTQPVAAAPCASGACAPAPMTVAAAPQVQYLATAAPVGVEYKVGAPEVVRTGLAIPGNALVCLGNGLKCFLESFFPTPVPTAKYVYAPPAAAPAPAAAAEPCR